MGEGGISRQELCDTRHGLAAGHLPHSEPSEVYETSPGSDPSQRKDPWLRLSTVLTQNFGLSGSSAWCLPSPLARARSPRCRGCHGGTGGLAALLPWRSSQATCGHSAEGKARVGKERPTVHIRNGGFTWEIQH